MSMSPETKQKLSAFHAEIKEAGENHLFSTFPQKIVQIHQFLRETANIDSPFHPSQTLKGTDPIAHAPPSDLESSEPQAKKRKLSSNGTSEEKSSDFLNPRYPHTVKANLKIVDLHAKVKEEAAFMGKTLDTVKLWVNLTMPKIEDGDNFGVHIQEEVLAELNQAQVTCFNLRDSARQHHQNRAKICTKLIKYPNVEDYTLALKEHDEKQTLAARQHLQDIRNMYAILTDMMHKNIAKIRTPKGNNSQGLY